MRVRPVRSLACLTAVALILAGSFNAAAQSNEFTNDVKYNSGQDIQPVYEGWTRNADGTFDLYFGYLNRNWVQQLYIPVGPNNKIEPGAADRGQPTYFYTRTNRKVFSVNVPANFGKQELQWTLTVNGVTRSVFGHLRADWEITADGGAGGTTTTKEARTNKAPSLTVAPVSAAQVSNPVTLAASVTDDGLPVVRERPKAAVGQETPPTLVSDTKNIPTNLPWLSEGGRARRGSGLTVDWMVFRGPADVKFDPDPAKVTDGKGTVTATFSEPGEYVLRGFARDGLLSTFQDVKITVSK